MRYSVAITDIALADAEEYVEFIRKQSHDEVTAANWWNGLLDAIDSLEMSPGRCPRIPEAKHFAEDLRQLLHASHRIIFELEARQVTVLRIYHSARRGLKSAKVRGRSGRRNKS